MSAVDVQNEILDPMQRLFLPPRKLADGEEQAVLLEYVRALEKFAAIDLKVAWQEVLETHTTRSWPLPAAFIQAARKARKDRLPETGRHKTDKPTQTELWDRWKVIRASQMGRDAVRRNVSWSLKCAVLHDGKNVDEINIAELVIGKVKAEKTADLIDAGKPVEWQGRTLTLPTESANAAMRLWRGIMVKEEETQQEIRNAA